MSVISQADYLTIANQYATAREQMLLARFQLYNSVREIVDHTGASAIDIEVDLLNKFWATYTGSEDGMSSTAYFLSAVRAINVHVINRSSYDTLHAYLAAYDPNYTVPYFWCEMCTLVGYSIPAGHCEAAPTWYTE